MCRCWLRGNAFRLIKYRLSFCHSKPRQSTVIPLIFNYWEKHFGLRQINRRFFFFLLQCDGQFPRRRLPPTELLHKLLVFTRTDSESQQPPLLLRISRMSTITTVTASAERCSGRLPDQTHSATNGDGGGSVSTTT